MAKTISLKASDLEAGDTASMRTIEWTDSEGASQSAKVLATGDIEIPAGADPEGVTVITSVKQFRVNGSKLELVLGTANSISGEAGDDITKEITLSINDMVAGISLSDTTLTAAKKSVTSLAASDTTGTDITLPAGGAFPPDGWSVQHRVTQIRWDTENYKLQIKSGDVLVKDDTEDAAWNDLISGVEFSV